MNLSTATVRQGDTEASFCIRLPRFQGQASSNQKMLGRLVDISYRSTGVRQIPFFINASTQYYRHQYPFFIKTAARRANTMESVARKLDDHFKKLAKEYPLHQAVPSIALNVDDDEDHHFVLSLPPRTALYSSSEMFFRGIGMGDVPEIDSDTRMMERGGRRVPVSMVVYGAFNHSYRPMQVRGERVVQGTTMDDLIPQTAVLPDNIFLQAEFMGADAYVMRTPPGEEVLQEATRDNVIRMLRIQFERLRQTLNLKTNLIEILPGAGESVYVGNRAFPDANMTISVEFNIQMSEVFGWEPGQQMVFPLELARTYEFQVRGERSDPFEKKYPLTLRLAAFGNSNSYFQGHGYTAVMAYLREKGGKDIDMTTVGLLFDSDATHISLQFLDRARHVVAFEDGYEISLLMKFQSL